jgi:hypothetical protein
MDALLVTFLVVPVAVALLGAGAASAALPRAFFVFGDSLVDNGNNNYLMTTARADAPPYGIDFPTHMPTGRFSNGLNIPDIISEHLGSQPALPYLSPDLRGDQLLVGANFASAGVGILNDTGIQFVRNNLAREPLRSCFTPIVSCRCCILATGQSSNRGCLLCVAR